MARKTLKQKQKSQIRLLKHVVGHQQSVIQQEHHHAGLTINFECQRTQAAGMAHGVMATLIEAKNLFDVESDAFKALEKVSQGRIAQCVVSLVQTGLSGEEANQRISQGH